VERLLYDLFLIDEADTVASKLSNGMKRRLNLALTLVHEPEIIVIDEPSIGLDPQSGIIILNYIQSLRDLDGKTVILITHDIYEADLSDRVAIVDNGQILMLDTPFNLKKENDKGDLVEIRLSNKKKNTEVIKNLKKLDDILWVDEVNGDIHLRLFEAKSKVSRLMENIKISNVHVKDFSVHQSTLGDVFTELTGISLEESK
jgi:ABC-2 type transport system ATP-binding protein